MHALAVCASSRLLLAGGSLTQRVPASGSLPGDAVVAITADTYLRLLSLADQAPLESLPLTPRTLACAKTLGYNLIGQIRSTPSHRLLADLGEDRTTELQRALLEFGVRQLAALAPSAD